MPAREYYEKNKEKYRAYAKKWREEHREELRAYHAEWYVKNREQERERQKVFRSKHRDRLNAERRAKDLLKNHGLTKEQFEEMAATQGGVCAICQEECKVATRLSVDHSHLTGKIRGLLCKNCNSGLGFFRDDPGLLAKAASYLDAFTKPEAA